MLAVSLFEFHIRGGLIFMLPLSIMALANLGITLLVLLSLLKKNNIGSIWLESIKSIGGLAAAWGTLSTIFGLFNIFSAIESSKEGFPIQVIAGGLQTALITIIYGVLILCFSLLLYIILQAMCPKKILTGN